MKIVTYHKDTGYLEHWLGLVEVMTVEPKPGIAADHGAPCRTRRPLGAGPGRRDHALGFQDPKAVEWLAARTGLPVVELPYTVGASQQVTGSVHPVRRYPRALEARDTDMNTRVQHRAARTASRAC